MTPTVKPEDVATPRDAVLRLVGGWVEESAPVRWFTTSIAVASRRIDAAPDDVSREMHTGRLEASINKRDRLINGQVGLYMRLYDIAPDRVNPNDVESVRTFRLAGLKLIGQGRRLLVVEDVIEAIQAMIETSESLTVEELGHEFSEQLRAVWLNADVQLRLRPVRETYLQGGATETCVNALHELVASLERERQSAVALVDDFLQRYAAQQT